MLENFGSRKYDGANQYLYDADGIRIAKCAITTWTCDPNSSGLMTAYNETEYILGAGGEQVTEMSKGINGSMKWEHTNVFAGGKLLATYDVLGLHFYLDDALGSRRVQTNYAGVVEQTCASLPFGDQLSCSGSSIGPTEHHFTGKERDAESGNDYFGARYYNSNMGRFLSPDWSANIEPVPYSKLDNPQSLNLYAYVMNNPLTTVDPDGHVGADGNLSDWMNSLLDDFWNFFGKKKGRRSGSYSSAMDNAHQQHAPAAQQQSGQAPANNTPGKQPIVVPNATDLVGQKVFGSGTCVDLAKAYGAPQTSQWTPGPAPDENTPKGTLVATFYSDNGTKFANQSGLSHVGAFDGTFEKTNGTGGTTTGIVLIDQYKGRSQIDYSKITSGGTRNYNSNASNYRIVLIPKKEGQ